MLAKEVIIITGCSGHVGLRAAHKFADPRFLVVGLDTSIPKITTTNFEFISCDITSREQVKKAMVQIGHKYGFRIASIIHLASNFSATGGNWQQYDNVTVKGTENLIDSLFGFQVEQLVFASTVYVYVPCEPGQRINEHWPVGPTWEFPQSKLVAEKILKDRHGKIPLVILRKACTYDDLCHATPLALQIQRIYERQSSAFFFPGNLTHATPYVHLDDVADAVWLTVQRRFGLPNEITMILSEPVSVSYGELQKVIGLLCYGEECKTWSIPKWLAKFAIRFSQKLPASQKIEIQEWMVDQADLNYSCDISLIQDKLGWAPKRSFRQTLPKMIAALKENPLAWYRYNNIRRNV